MNRLVHTIVDVGVVSDRQQNGLKSDLARTGVSRRSLSKAVKDAEQSKPSHYYKCNERLSRSTSQLTQGLFPNLHLLYSLIDDPIAARSPCSTDLVESISHRVFDIDPDFRDLFEVS
jgi:hypothetical protein